MANINLLLAEAEAQLAFERQRDIRAEGNEAWTLEYHAGYIDGIKQVISLIKEAIGKREKNCVSMAHDEDIEKYGHCLECQLCNRRGLKPSREEGEGA